MCRSRVSVLKSSLPHQRTAPVKTLSLATIDEKNRQTRSSQKKNTPGTTNLSSVFYACSPGCQLPSDDGLMVRPGSPIRILPFQHPPTHPAQDPPPNKCYFAISFYDVKIPQKPSFPVGFSRIPVTGPENKGDRGKNQASFPENAWPDTVSQPRSRRPDETGSCQDLARHSPT